MKKITILLLMALIVSGSGFSQVGINNDGSAPSNSAMLDVKSTSKGFLPPRMTTAQRDLIPAPSVGLVIFNTDCGDLQYFNGSEWVPTGNTGFVAQPGTITGSSTPCVNASGVSYSVNAVPGATGYHWTVPGGAAIATGQGSNAISVNFGTGNGLVCVAALNDCFRSLVSCSNITLSPTIYAGISVSANATTVCEGTQATFTAVPVNGGTSPAYQWKKNNIDIPGATNTTYTYAPANNDKISCRLISNAPCVAVASVYSNAVTMTVVTAQPVSVSVGASANNVCAGTQVTFSATPTNGGTSPAYQWRKNGNNISGATNQTYSYIPLNADGISCVLTSNANCTSGNPATSNTITMTVNPVVPVSISISASANPSCAGSSVVFTATPVNGGTNPQYQWKKNGNNVTGATNGTYTFIPANGDQVSCLLTSNANCPSGNPATSNTITMTVNQPVAVSVSISANATLVCAGTQVTFTATPVNGGANPSYQWRKNGNNISGATGSTYTYAPANNDAVTCRMTSGLNCVTGNPATSNAITMTVVATQPVSITITASANPIITGTSVTFTATPVNGGTSPLYQWKKNGSNISGATNITYTYTPLNGDQISCVLTSNVLCGTGSPATSNVITMTVTGTCGNSFTISHTAGAVAPVSKTVTYGTVTNIPGEPSKCWITRNLGASQQASSSNDNTEASAGWYWQFNRKQGYKYDAGPATPAWTITGISETSNWLSANDPCNIELGAAWRIPTYTEWFNVDNSGGWTNASGPWSSGLKMHVAGAILYSTGELYGRGSTAEYTSGTETATTTCYVFQFGADYSDCQAAYQKAGGYSVRCLKQ